MRNFLFSCWENLIYILVGILFINVVILDIITFVSKPQPIVQNINLKGGTTASTETVQGVPQQVAALDACPVTCMTAIKTATASLKLTQNVINNTTTTQPQQTAASSGSNEYFVPFGAATAVSQGTYTTVGGLQAYVNMSEYTNVQSVVFEVSITGNGIASVQLYDATDGYAIPNSQVTTPGGTPQLLISSPLNLPAGNKLYQVQINTQLNSAATINSARLHITLN